MNYYMMPNETISDNGLRDFLSCLRRRRKIIILFTLVAVIVGCLFSFGATRVYEAHSTLLVQQNDRVKEGSSTPSEAVILSTVEMIRSREIADMVVDDLQLTDNKQFWRGSIETKEKAAMRVLDNLHIKAVGRSLVIDVAFRHENAVLSAQIANGVVLAYQMTQLEDRTKTSDRTNKWLTKKLGELASNAKVSAQKLQEYRVQNNMITYTKNDIAVQQTRELNAQLIQAIAEQATAHAFAEKRKSTTNINALIDNPVITTLTHDESLLLMQQSQLQTKYGSNHPRLKAVQAELYSVKAKKAEVMKQSLAGLDDKVAIADAKVASLTKALHDQQTQQLAESAASTDLRNLERTAETDQELYDDFLMRSKDMMMSNATMQPSVKVISAARAPDKTINANMFVILLLCAISGLILGIMAALLLDQFEMTAQPKREDF